MAMFRKQLRGQTERAKGLGEKVATAKPGGERQSRLMERQEKLSGRMERSYGRMQRQRGRMGMESGRQIGSARMARRMDRR